MTIPRVDTDDQTGNFQDGVFQFDSQTGAWNLLSFKSTPAVQGAFDQVEVIVTNDSPVQVFLKVSGQFNSSCGEIERTYQRLKDNRFEVSVYFKEYPPLTLCFQVITPFEKIIPLQVYGLSAGTYEYSVNGEHTGTFDLLIDNKF